MAEEKGGLYERWQYRQEMIAHNVWDRWGLPTRDEYEQFHEARNLKDTMDTWLPEEVERLSLPQMMGAIDFVTPDEQQRIEDLTNKELHVGLAGPDYHALLELWEKVTAVPVLEHEREHDQGMSY